MARKWLNSADVQIDDETGALLVKIAADSGAGRTFSSVAITQGAAGWFTLKGHVAGKTPKLHALLVVADTDGTTITLQSADDESGTTPVALSGAIPVPTAGGGFMVQPVADPRLCLGAPVGKSLGLTSVTGKVFGWAIVSMD